MFLYLVSDFDNNVNKCTDLDYERPWHIEWAYSAQVLSVMHLETLGGAKPFQ